jgi:type IV pilus assembly protein PilE
MDLRARGFSLVELLVTVGIVAILASIAIPSYRAYVIRSNRSHAEQLMTTLANREAQYLLDARAYTARIGSAGLNVTRLDDWTCDLGCANTYYNVTVQIGASPADGFTISAVPVGYQAKDGTIELKSDGNRSRKISGVDKGW